MAEPELGRPLRVGLVLSTSTGGVGRHVRSLAAGLVARGCEVAVRGPLATEQLFRFTAAGADFRPVSLGAPRRTLPGVDVVHGHGLRAGFVAGLGAPRQVPLVVTWHNAVLGSGVRRRTLTWLEGHVARRADVTLAASADLVERARAMGARDVRLAPVAAPRLADGAARREQVRADLGVGERPVVLAVGRLAPQKDYRTLAAAVRRWRARPERPLTLVAGDGEAAEAAVLTAGLDPDDLRLLGRRDDVGDLLAAADVLVVTSLWEARSLVVQEAMRAGLPVVATRTGGLVELVEGAGVLVPVGDAPAVADAVVRLLVDHAERDRLGALGRERAETWPDEDDTTEQCLAVYRELLRR